jgi:O-antigen/teichoic acid export membrane protein
VTRTAKFLTSIRFGVVNQVVTALGSILLTPYFLSRVGDAPYGVWLMSSSILGYLSLLDLGAAAILPREIAIAHGKELAGNARGKTPTTVVWAIGLLQLPLLALACAICYGVFLRGRDDGAMALLLASYCFLFPFRIFNAVLVGRQDFAFLGYLALAQWLLSSAVSILLMHWNPSLFALSSGWLAGQLLVTGLSALRLTLRYRADVPEFLKPPSLATIRDWLSRSTWVTLGNLAYLLRMGSDLLVIGHFLGSKAVVVYSCTVKLPLFLSQLPQQLLSSARSGLFELVGLADTPRLRRVSSSLEQLALGSAAFVAGLSIVLNESFVGVWIDATKFGGLTLTVITGLHVVARHYAIGVNAVAFALGHERALGITALVDGCLALGLMTLGVPSLGLVAAAAAPLISVCLVSIPVGLHLTGRGMERSSAGWAAATIPWLVRVGALLAVACFIAWSRPRLETAIAGALGVGIGAVVLYAPLLLNGPIRDYLPARLVRAHAVVIRWRGSRSPVGTEVSSREPAVPPKSDV